MMRILLSCIFLLSVFFLSAVTRFSTGNGAWVTAGTWNPSGAPGCGDSVIVQAGHNVTVTSQVNLENCASPVILVVRGNLLFTNGDKLRFPCNSRMYVFGGGQIIPGNGGGNSNLIEICNTKYWNAGSGTYTGPGCLPPTQPGCSAILPVSLLLFRVYECEPFRCFEWQTASELNNSHFVLERTIDGVVFEEVTTIASKAKNGFSSESLKYNYSEKVTEKKLFYYRLRQVDFNGSATLSTLVVTETNNSVFTGIEPQIYPVPNNGKFQLSGQFEESIIELVFISTDGSQRNTYKLRTLFNVKDYQVDLSSVLKPGIYTCIIEVGGQNYFRKLIVSED